jgi:hypothetical protein
VRSLRHGRTEAVEGRGRLQSTVFCRADFRATKQNHRAALPGGTLRDVGAGSPRQLYTDDSSNLSAPQCEGDCCSVWSIVSDGVGQPARSYVRFTSSCALRSHDPSIQRQQLQTISEPALTATASRVYALYTQLST